MAGIEGARPNADEARAYGILIVDDEEAILESLELTLGIEYRVFTAASAEAGLEILDREDIALVISDQVMPGMSGVEFLEKVIERNPRATRMMLTGYADMPSLIAAINEGRIWRYIPKPWEPDDLRIAVKRGLEVYALSSENAQLADALAEANERLRAENVYLRGEVEARYSFDGIIGDAPAMQKIFDVTQKVSQTAATVLLTGETGTGKDLLARAIHYSGPRKDRKFVAQNCGALPDTLLESELFGHKRGSFTGAHTDKKGLFEVADGGTIFLDEIGETEPGMQVRLLRVLQDGEIRPLGSSDTKTVASGSWRRRTAISSRWWRTGASGRTSTTACGSSRSRCPRFGSAARTSPPSRTTFSTRPRSGWAGSSSGSRTPPWIGSSATRGPATSGSSPTKSSGRRRSPGPARRSGSTIYRSTCGAALPGRRRSAGTMRSPL